MKNKIIWLSSAFLLAVLTLFVWFYPKSDFSESERRVLAPMPELSAESISPELLPAALRNMQQMLFRSVMHSEA